MSVKIMQLNPLRAVEIEMYEAVIGNNEEIVEFAEDFFCSPDCEDIPGLGRVVLVEDVDYCIDYARDWETCRGDYCYDDPDPTRSVIVTELPVNERMVEEL